MQASSAKWFQFPSLPKVDPVANPADVGTPVAEVSKTVLKNKKSGVNHQFIREKLDSIEQEKLAWGKWIAAHPYSNRKPGIDKDKSIPKKDRPDLAVEQNFLMTVDPKLKKVPFERLEAAEAQMKEIFEARKTVEINAALMGVTWKERGPSNIGGRTRALAFDLNDATYKKVWAGGVNGGLWYTNDITSASPVWVHVDDFWDNIAISTIAIDPSNPYNIYVGTGEGWFNTDGSRGAGIWKSADGGANWSRLSTTIPGSAIDPNGAFDHITKIVVKSDGTVFATTRGRYLNVGGLYRSTDGGTTWNLIKTQYTAGSVKYDFSADVEIASNGDVYVSFGIAYGTPGVYRSSDNGATWTDLATTIGLSSNQKRVEIACSPSENVVYFMAEDGTSLTDNDLAWIKRLDASTSTVTTATIPIYGGSTSTHFTRGQAWYDLILAVHPTNANLIIAGGIDLYRSVNGGTSWLQLSSWSSAYGPYVHADQHAIQFRPGDANSLIFGNDGGVFYSTNAGNSAVAEPTFASKNTGYNVTQFYSVSGKNEVNSHHFIGGAQDNGSLSIINPTSTQGNELTGGDGGYVFIDQDNPNYQITSYTYNNYYFSTDSGRNFPQEVSSQTGHFINPAVWDDNSDILYSATNANQLLRTTGIGGTIQSTLLNLANAGGGKISALKMSPHNPHVLFVGVDNGRVLKISQANVTPSDQRLDVISPLASITTAGWVSSIDVGASDNQLLVTFSNYGVTSVWETTDGGSNWISKEGNLPDIPIRWAIYNPANRNQVMVATELGVWTTDNRNATNPVWGPSNANLAHTRCDMLYYRAADKMVAVATHGRGIFTTDYFATTAVADFMAATELSCTGSLTTTLYDQSIKPNNSWAWDIGSNGTVDYTTQNPTHTFGAGLHTVRLTVNNGSATKLKLGNVLVMNAPPPLVNSTPPGNSNFQNGGGLGISRFALNTLDHYSLPDDGNYQNYSCSAGTLLLPGTTYTVTVHTGIYNNEFARVYIDYNGDGDFLDANELVAAFASGLGGRSTTFTTPSTGLVYNTGVRIRVISKYLIVPTSATDIGSYGQAEDYTAYFIASALPVQLTEFTATCSGQQVVAKWTTASESNSSHFELQRNTEGEIWETVGRVQAAGNSQVIRKYQYTDRRPLTGTTLYRLHQVDADGKDSYSAVSVVSCSTQPVVVYPNPASNEVTLANLKPGTAVSLFTIQGKKIQTVSVSKGLVRLPLAAYPPGIYVLQWLDNGQVVSRRIVVQR